MTHLNRLSQTFGLLRSVLIYYGQPWRRRDLKRFYRNLISPGDLVFDIGAHVGSRSKTLLSLGADVVAIEPQPVFAAFLKRHFSGQLKALEQVAVGPCSGNVTLQISSRHPTVTSISREFVSTVSQSSDFRKVVWDREINVPMVTLSQLITRHGKPAFCKIDVEGAEAHILQGLDQPLKLIAFEYVPAAKSIAVDCIQRLEALGPYRFNRVTGERHKFAQADWVDGSQIRDFLSALREQDPSGDIYAQLEA
ncbi:FkbM family methyltransferase [Roseibium limicola]|uniref:FkbM family methyltransferase n=1 Tax=Roseibium limicola TaxID=2816037 RepID=UPI001AD8B865|nr:FkbM family methyltransferase [Roseibium limicola]